LSDVLKSRAEVLAGAALARATTVKAIATLRTTCDKVKAKRVALLNATNQTSMKFLHTLHDQLQVYEDVVHEARGKNDMEEKYAMSLAAKVDEAAAKCMTSMESITSRIVTQKKAERRPIGDDVLAVGSIMNGKATKADGVGAKDVNEQGAAWAQQVYSTERQRALDHGPKAHEVPLLLVEVAKSDSDDAQEVEELKKQALLIDQKLEKAERAGKVGDKLPADLVGNAEATSETFWKDVGSLNEQDVADATPEDEKEVGRLVTEVSQMDDDLVTPDKEKQVPLEYSKLSEELGELKGEGEI